MRARNARSRCAGSWPRTSHLAGVGRAVALEDLHERGLARAVGAEDGEHLPAPDVEVDAVERRRDAVVGLAQAAHAHRGRGGARHRRPGGRRARRHGDFEVVRDHAKRIGRAGAIRHRRAGRTSPSTRGWRRDTPGSTLATMTPAREAPTVQGVKLVNLRELPPIAGTGPPVALRIVGFVSLAVVSCLAVTTDPTPGLHGDGPWVALGHRPHGRRRPAQPAPPRAARRPAPRRARRRDDRDRAC